MSDPIIVGGNGHSGTRLFAEILMARGVYMGYSGFSYSRKSKDLNIRALMSRWMKPYLLGLDEASERRMQSQFKKRLRLLLPVRPAKWGFKNPRSMFLLPFYFDLFPQMKFIHVVRDGRDMCFGNPFIHSPAYWGVLSEEEAQSMSPEERMMLFWGRSNLKVREFGVNNLGSRYIMIRFEDICDQPRSEIERILDLIDEPIEKAADLVPLVRKPKSIGRWETFPAREIDRVVTIGEDYLREFGYS